MNLRFLGDVLDHWKGSLVAQLSGAGLLDGFRVDQMATDFGQWGEVDRCLYAELLNVDRSSLVVHSGAIWANRKAYLQELKAIHGDLFLDPDAGICTNSRPGVEHLKATELEMILDSDPGRIVMVYQHIRARKTRDRVIEIMNFLQEKGLTFHAYAYESSSAAMLFFSRRSDRVDLIGGFYRRLLDWHAEDRIFHWQTPSTNLRLIKER